MLVAAVRRTFPARRSVTYYSVARTIDRDALHRAIRLAIYANDGAAFTTNRDLFDKEWAPHRAVHFLTAMLAGVPLAVDWLASRHPAIQLALFEAKFFGFQRLGLLENAGDGPKQLLISNRGRATWRLFLQRGGQYPEDLTQV
jgi:hypothetical protein